MPCSDGGPVYAVDPQTIARLHKVTRLLCGVMTFLSPNTRNGLCARDPELSEWWEEHQEHDRRRKKAEEAAAQRERDREAALAKLSPRERKALGL